MESKWKAKRKEHTMKLIKEIAKVVGVLVGIFVTMVVLAGCATSDKTRTIDADGMYANAASETIAIGSVKVMSSSKGEEAAFVEYEEDNAWLQPSMKLHNVRVQLSGTNTTHCVTNIVNSICDAFIAVKPSADIGIDKGERRNEDDPGN